MQHFNFYENRLVPRVFSFSGWSAWSTCGVISGIGKVPDISDDCKRKNRRAMEVRLRGNRVAILKDLEPKKHWNYLIQEGVLDYDDLDDLKAEKTRKARAELLLGKVLLTGVRKINIFVKSLSIHQPHLYELLQRDLPETLQRQQGNYIESGNCTEVVFVKGSCFEVFIKVAFASFSWNYTYCICSLIFSKTFSKRSLTSFELKDIRFHFILTRRFKWRYSQFPFQWGMMFPFSRYNILTGPRIPKDSPII